MGADSKLLVGEVAVASRVKKLPSPVALAAPVCRIATFHPASLAALVASFPALVALRESFPGTYICAYARAPVLPLLSCFGAIDEAKARPGGGLSAQAALMARLHTSEIDLALSFSQGANSMLLLWATGAKVRAGFVPSRLEAFLTHRVEKSGAFTATTGLELVREVGAAPRGRTAQEFLAIPPATLLKVDALVEAAGIASPFVILAPAVARRSKKPRQERDNHYALWSERAQQLAQRWPIVTVAPRHFEVALGSTPHPILDLTGKIDSLHLAALITRGATVVGDESGAVALGKFMHRPVVELTDAQQDLEILSSVQRVLGV